jgi:hypothetical protein
VALLRTLTVFHAVIAAAGVRVVSPVSKICLGGFMKTIFKLLIPMSLLAMSGCVVAPYGYHRGWYGPRVAVIAPLPLLPPPVVIVRP